MMRIFALPLDDQKKDVTPVACRRCRSLLSFSSRLRFSSVSPSLGATTSCRLARVFTSTPHSCVAFVQSDTDVTKRSRRQGFCATHTRKRLATVVQVRLRIMESRHCTLMYCKSRVDETGISERTCCDPGGDVTKAGDAGKWQQRLRWPQGTDSYRTPCPLRADEKLRVARGSRTSSNNGRILRKPITNHPRAGC